MKTFRRLATLLTVALILMACSGSGEPEAASDNGGPVTASGFPAMSVADLESFLAKNADKPTLALMWTTWCPSCKQELPELEALQASHGDRVNIMAISLDEDAQALKKFFSGKKLDLPVYHGDEALGRKFGVEAIPTLLIFDTTGKLVFNQPGVFPHAMLERMVGGMLK
ncbi:TlpA disulfide reductase family protein [uncultured Pseudodesulfovibrio sp.]|uniref:TlpA family protein disulfide reductase n=1 Tax=uncultured Pseudodesulfovibrio sp. TaxID=2035858 RepID=UPI0029C7954B|nr:TlpA disulfide reductase family protein [uncultured Pseudodesulfovibrio sp.]